MTGRRNDQPQRKAGVTVVEEFEEWHAVNDRDSDVLGRLNVASDRESIRAHS